MEKDTTTDTASKQTADDPQSLPSEADNREFSSENLPCLEDEEVVRLIDIMRRQDDGARDGAMVFLFDHILGHCYDGNYIFTLSCVARDRALYHSDLAEDGIRAFAAKVAPRINEQLAEWEAA
jgi:hypothetical protein